MKFYIFKANQPPYLSALDFLHSLVELDIFSRLPYILYFKLEFSQATGGRKISSSSQIDFIFKFEINLVKKMPNFKYRWIGQIINY